MTYLTLQLMFALQGLLHVFCSFSFCSFPLPAFPPTLCLILIFRQKTSQGEFICVKSENSFSCVKGQEKCVLNEKSSFIWQQSSAVAFVYMILPSAPPTLFTKTKDTGSLNGPLEPKKNLTSVSVSSCHLPSDNFPLTLWA